MNFKTVILYAFIVCTILFMLSAICLFVKTPENADVFGFALLFGLLALIAQIYVLKKYKH